MTTWNRHGDAPYQDGESLAGADLETDFTNGLAVVNGGIDNSNIAPAANIDGSKLKDASIADAKMTASTLTLASMNAAAVPKAYVSTSSAAANFGGGTAWGDINGITAATLTPGQSGDFIEMDCTITGDKEALVADTVTTFGFEVAVGTAAATATAVAAKDWDIEDKELVQPITWTFSFAATSTDSVVIVPQVQGDTATSPTDHRIAYATSVLRVFRARIIPIKS